MIRMYLRKEIAIQIAWHSTYADTAIPKIEVMTQEHKWEQRVTSKSGQTHVKSDREILFTQHKKTHTHKKKNLGQNSFPQKTANIWKLGTVVRETKSVSMLKGNQLGGWGMERTLGDMKQLQENKIKFSQKVREGIFSILVFVDFN